LEKQELYKPKRQVNFSIFWHFKHTFILKGEFTRLKQSVVSSKALSKISLILHIESNLYVQLHPGVTSTGCPKKKFTQSPVKIELAQWKINIFEPFKNQKNRAVSAVLII